MTVTGASRNKEERGHSGFWQRLVQFALLLALVQIARAFVTYVLWQVAPPGANSTLMLVESAAAFVIIAIALWLWLRPSANELGLDWSGTPRAERVAYIGSSLLLIALILSTVFFSADALAANIYDALFLPAFEELLFRGYGWSRIRGDLAGKYAGLITWLSVSALFGLWHLGYADAVLRAPALLRAGAPHIGFILSMKVVVGVIVGLLAGLARWRTNRVYGAFLIHALWNMFGR